MDSVKRTITSELFFAELVTRVNVVIISVGAYLLTNQVLSSLTDGVLILICYSSIEIWLISVIAKRYKDSNFARDYNELNVYSLIMHLIAIPGYIYGVPSEYHNGAIQIIMWAHAVRLCYFGREANGDFGGLPTFGLFAIIQRNLASKSKLALFIILFLLGSIPVWYVVTRGGENIVIATIILGMTYAFVVPNRINNIVLALVLSVFAMMHLIMLLPARTVPKIVAVQITCTGAGIAITQSGSRYGREYAITGDIDADLKCTESPPK